jgi:nondiscriminating aspartyl-tRNA synthetase
MRVKMKRTFIKELKVKIDQQILLEGWVQTMRDQGSIKFLVIRDISGTAQTVVLKGTDAFETIEKLSIESVVKVIGVVKNAPQAPGGIEVKAESVQVLSLANLELPIQVVEKNDNEAEQQKRLDWRWIDLRKTKKSLIFKVWTTMEQAFREYCISNDFIEIHSPKIVVTSTESGSELFEINYFDRKAYLAQSPQLYKQMAMASGFEKVFEVGPVFRANPSFTSRHDTEFTMYDIEMSFIESHHELMAEEEKMMASMFSAVKGKYGEEIEKAYGQEVKVPMTPFPKLTLKEAKKILKDLKVPSERGEDLSPEEERAISNYIKEKYGHEFVFIHEWPSSVRAFYSMRLDSDSTVTKSFDLLYKGLEITSGAQREHRKEILEKQILEQGLTLEPFKSYLNFFEYGCPPHGGFAPGPTRILMKLFGLENVREVTYLYRGVNRITP